MTNPKSQISSKFKIQNSKHGVCIFGARSLIIITFGLLFVICNLFIGNSSTFASMLPNLPPVSEVSADSFFAKNLYQNVYETLRDDGDDLAIERVLADRHISAEELKLLIPGDSIADLLTEEDLTTKTSPGTVEARRAELATSYKEQKELADFEVALKAEVEPTEIFANGTESDSGFDLIVDLNIIEAILFAKDGASAGGFNFGDDQGTTPDSGITGDSSDRQPPSGPGIGSGTGVGPGSGSGPSGTPPDSGVDIPSTADVCPADSSFNNAVNAALTNENQNGSGIGANDGNSGGGSSGAGNSGAPGNVGPRVDENGIIQPEPAADWNRGSACTGVFCLKIEAIYKKESSYFATDNCIACHFEKINDSFKKTFSHNIIPSKLTGNLIEPGKCKNAVLDGWFKFNLVFIPQPILTPPNDDLIVKGDFIKNIKDYYEKYYDNPGRCKSGAGGSCKHKDQVQEITNQVLSQVPENSDQKSVLDSIARQVAAKKDEALKVIKETQNAQDAQNQVTQYSVLMQEITSMKNYFSSFSALFQKIGSPETAESGLGPCTLLLHKETCQ